MSARQVPGLALDPRTKILIWLLANVVVFTWSPAVFRIGVMLAYFLLFLLERKGKMLASLLVTYFAILAIQYWLLPVLPGALLATAFATVTYFILVFPCIAGGTYIIATTSVSQFMAALERMRVSRNFSITLAVTLRFLRRSARTSGTSGTPWPCGVSGDWSRSWSASMSPCSWGGPDSGGTQRVRHRPRH